MKKMLIKVGALLIALVMFAGAPVCVLADSSYTYNYDFWEEYQECPDAYTPASVITSVDLKLETPLKSPSGMLAYGEFLYVCDTGNNRILELKRSSIENLEVVRIISEFKGDVEVTTFSSPNDIAISEKGDIFIADTGNARVVKLDSELNYLMEFVKPDDTTLDPELVFQPTKLVVDTAGRVYCIATGINKGLIKYEPDGTFSGFVGATPVKYNTWEYIYKKFFATQEQIELMVSFVPTEYNNLYMDSEGFIYTTLCGEEQALKDEEIQAVRKLNLIGNDILIRNGNYPIFGDIYMGSGGGYAGPSYFADITVFDNDIYVCLDRTRGRLFAYDDQGRLVYAFGGNGNMDGYFRRPVSIEHMGYDLFVLDTLDCAITVFVPTEFGSTIYNAVDLFDAGDYDGSGEAWQKAMDIDGNYELAYIGIGRSLLRQKRYKEAMDYFKYKYDDDNYSKAFKQYRKEWVEDHIAPIVIVIVLLFAIPMIIGKIKAIKHEIDTADIFQ